MLLAGRVNIRTVSSAEENISEKKRTRANRSKNYQGQPRKIQVISNVIDFHYKAEQKTSWCKTKEHAAYC
jgi:hypothetical protein